MATTFEKWMQRVDTAIAVASGVGIETADLPDQPYMDWYQDEMTPREAAMNTLEDAGFPMDVIQ